MALICNLVQEFNGLVSKGVNRKIGPFALYNMINVWKLAFLKFIDSTVLTRNNARNNSSVYVFLTLSSAPIHSAFVIMPQSPVQLFFKRLPLFYE